MFLRRKDDVSFIERVKAQFKQVLALNVPSHTMALSCATGMAIGLSPYIFAHSYMAFLFASVLRLPVIPVLVFSCLNTPITMPVIAALETKAGLYIIGSELDSLPDWSSLGVWDVLKLGKSILIPFFLGSHIVSVILGVFTYFISYCIVKRYKKYKTEG